MVDVLIGTYTQGRSEGIYRLSLDEATGRWQDAHLFATLAHSKYLETTDSAVYSLYGEGGRGGVAVFDWTGHCLDKLLFEDAVPCYLCIEGDTIYTSNYHLGTVAKLHFDPTAKKLHFVDSYTIRQGAGAHQVILHEGRLLVPCLHLDEVIVLNPDLTMVGTILTPKGSGCRHGVVSRDGTYLYLLGELSNKIYTISLETGRVLSQVGILPQGVSEIGGGGALRVSQNGNTLFASVRGKQNLIAILAVMGETLAVTHRFSAEGTHPRDILPVCNDRFLLVANRDSDSVAVFDCKNEYLHISTMAVPEGVAVAWKGH